MDHTVVHFEIPADDPERATKFYRELFGWDIQKFAADGGPEYWLVRTVPADAPGRPTRPGVNGGAVAPGGARRAPREVHRGARAGQPTRQSPRAGARRR